MMAKDWFGVIVRAGGLYLVIAGICSGLLVIAGDDAGRLYGAAYHATQVLSELVIGVILLGGANLIVRFSYPDGRQADIDTSGEP
jgi:hypothetical protein